MPLFWLSIAFMVGIIFSARVQWSTSTWLAMAGISLILVAFFTWRKNRTADSKGETNSRFYTSPQFFFLVLFSFALGAARFQVSQPDLNSPGFIANYNDAAQEARVMGMIIKPPEVQDSRVVLRIKAEGIQPYGAASFAPVSGLLVARVNNVEDWQYGDRIMLRGDLETPPEFEDFSYRAYLEQQGVYSYMRNARTYRTSSGGGNFILRAIYTYKDHALSTLYRLWPDPEASLLAGILLGVESGIPEDVDQAFRDTGTSHM